MSDLKFEQSDLIKTVGDILKPIGYKKKSARKWYKQENDLVTYIELQKSMYGDSYYINVHFGIIFDGEEKLSTITGIRIDDFVKVINDKAKNIHFFTNLLNLDNDLSFNDRQTTIAKYLNQLMVYLKENCSSKEAIKQQIVDGNKPLNSYINHLIQEKLKSE